MPKLYKFQSKSRGVNLKVVLKNVEKLGLQPYDDTSKVVLKDVENLGIQPYVGKSKKLQKSFPTYLVWVPKELVFSLQTNGWVRASNQAQD